MAQAPPLVEHGLLAQPEGAAAPIAVGTPAWYAWLLDARSFAFHGEHGRFTALKERRGGERAYWKAYRRQAGVLRRVYLGTTAELSLDRLNAVAAELARRADAAGPGATPADRRPAGAPAQHGPAPPDGARSLQLVATKLMGPALRADTLLRPRLLAQLDGAIGGGHRLIVLSAPAGFGKTTLVAAWLARPRAQASAWLALDAGDNSLEQFLAYLIAAFEQLRPQIGAEAWALLRAQAARPPAHAIIGSLVNALAREPGHAVLIFDDYHVITLQAIHDAVAFLLDHAPAQLALVVTSRGDPPLPRARLRAHGQLTELRASDLGFSAAEAGAFFDRAPGLQLSSKARAILVRRIDGWAAGLQLAVLALEKNAAQLEAFVTDFSGSHRYVFDYLVDEVFQRQPAEVQAFLTQTAVLPRFCGPLCAALVGGDDAQAILEQLDRANLFLVPLDERRQWYRYHHLFGEFLCARLRQASGAAAQLALHRRASVWFEAEGLIREAVDHSLSARAWDDALRMLGPLMADEAFYGHYLDWPRWLTALPDAALAADGAACLRLAWVLILTGHAEAAQRPLALAESLWRTATDPIRLGETLCFRALGASFTNNSPQLRQAAQEALAVLPPEARELRAIAGWCLGRDHVAAGRVGQAAELMTAAHLVLQDLHERYTVFARTAALSITRVAHLQGRLREAAAGYQELIRSVSGVLSREQPAVYLFLGQLHYERNELEAAEQVLRAGLVAGQRTGRDRYWPSAYSSLARVLWAQGDRAEAHDLAAQAIAAAQALGSLEALVEAEAEQAWLSLAEGDLASAARWVERRTLGPEDAARYERRAESRICSRVLLVHARRTGDADMAEAAVLLLERMQQSAEADTRQLDSVADLILLALARSAQGRQQQALGALAAVLGRTLSECYIRSYVDEGPPMRSLLAVYKRQLKAGALTAAHTRQLLRYLERLLAAFPSPGDTGPVSGVTIAVSQRERAVLAQLAEGRSVQEIADLLIISPHTARTHIKNIYAKFEVHSRVQAVERARALGLL